MLPPGPREPAAVADRRVGSCARPRCCGGRRRATGEPFTLRTAWKPRAAGARVVAGGGPAGLHGRVEGRGEAPLLEPFAGPELDPGPGRGGAPAPAPADAAALPRGADARCSPLVAELAEARGDELAGAVSCDTLPRMQALTLDVIVRTVFGNRAGRAARRDPPRAGRRRLHAAPGGDVAGCRASACGGGSGRPWPRVDPRSSTRSSTSAAPRRPLLDDLRAAPEVTRPGAARPARDDPRGRPRDDGDRAGPGAGAARPPPAPTAARRPTSTPPSRRSCGPGRCSPSRPARRSSRTQLREYTLPPGSTSPPACYLAHRRAGPDFDPRALPRRPGARPLHVHPVRRRDAPLPGRGLRDAGDARGAPSGLTTLHIGPRSRAGRRMRRRSVTLAPARGGSIIPHTR